MSCRRLSAGVYRDPWTGQTIDPAAPPEPLPALCSPVLRRKATPAELARLSGDAPRQIPAYPGPRERASVRTNRRTRHG